MEDEIVLQEKEIIENFNVYSKFTLYKNTVYVLKIENPLSYVKLFQLHNYRDYMKWLFVGNVIVNGKKLKKDDIPLMEAIIYMTIEKEFINQINEAVEQFKK